MTLPFKWGFILATRWKTLRLCIAWFAHGPSVYFDNRNFGLQYPQARHISVKIIMAYNPFCNKINFNMLGYLLIYFDTSHLSMLYQIVSSWIDFIYPTKMFCIIGNLNSTPHFFLNRKINIWVRSRNCSCLVTRFCYQLIAKPGNKTAAVPWPDPYIDLSKPFTEMTDINVTQLI